MSNSGRKVDDKIAKRISKNIRTIRICLGYTQQQVADRVKISRTQLSKYENKIKTPNAIILNRIALVLNVKLDNILNNDLVIATKNGIYFDIRRKKE